MTNWVTIKIPEDTRDDAKDDPRTYEQIIQDGLQVEPGGTVDLREEGADDIVGELKDELSMAADPGVDESEIVNSVVKRIDDLETELKAQIEGLQKR